MKPTEMKVALAVAFGVNSIFSGSGFVFFFLGQQAELMIGSAVLTVFLLVCMAIQLAESLTSRGNTKISHPRLAPGTQTRPAMQGETNGGAGNRAGATERRPSAVLP